MERYEEVTRRQIIELVQQTRIRSGWAVKRTLRALNVAPSTFFAWRDAAALVPRYRPARNLLEPLPAEKAAVCEYALAHSAEGYRRLTWMMLDEGVAALSQASVYRILRAAGLNRRWRRCVYTNLAKPQPPRAADEQWHTDLMYLWVGGRWYFFVAVLDAYSRYIVHWELLQSMLAHEVVDVIRRALEKTPAVQPRIVHDRGAQFTGREFRALIRHFSLHDITVRVAHPESNGVYERFNGSTRREGIGDTQLHDLYHARDILGRWVTRYNEQRLHSSLGYLPPAQYYRGDPQRRQHERKAKLAAALQIRVATNRERLTQQAA
jgi:putative transposase